MRAIHIRRLRGSVVVVAVAAALALGGAAAQAAPAAPAAVSGASAVSASAYTLTDSAASTPTPPSAFVPVTPVRIMDTRSGSRIGPVTGPVASDTSISLPIDGNTTASLPSAGVSAVAVSITVTGQTASGYLTVYPAGASVPGTSAVNFTSSGNVTNNAIIPVGSDGDIAVHNESGGTVQIIIDLTGYFTTNLTAADASTYTPLASPARIFDTRYGTGVPEAPLAANTALTVPVAGDDTNGAGVPSTGVTAVALNITAVVPGGATGSLEAYPGGAARPEETNLNFHGGADAATIIIPVGGDGDIEIANSSSVAVNLVGDLSGYFTTSATGQYYYPLPGSRIVKSTAVGSEDTLVTSTPASVPPDDNPTMIVNITATSPTAGGELQAYPTSAGEPTATIVNYSVGETVPNLALVNTATDDEFTIANRSTGSTDVIVDTNGYFAPQRDADAWPFTWDSVWNIPIASTATYAAAGITSNGTSENDETSDYDSTDPSFPVVTLENADTTSGTIGPVSVYGDPAMTAQGEWNTCSAWLGTDNNVYQGQTTEVTAGGNPSFAGEADATWAPVPIEGAGTTGCHGGSGLSGLGGTLTLADLTQSGPITHALKVALDGVLNYSNANGGYRWPATTADAGYNDPSSGNYYGGTNTNVQEGSLLALPPSISPSSFSDPYVRKIATAIQDYGAYIVDTTATGTYDNSTVITNYNAAWPLMDEICGSSCTPNTPVFTGQLNTLLTELEVVTNNTSSTPGGGTIGASRCAPYAPEFIDGTDAPPSASVVSC